MASRGTRSITHKMCSIASNLGFTNGIREIRQLTDNPIIAIIVEHPSPESDYTRVAVIHLTNNDFFYNKACPAFPESLTDANITIDDDGFNIHLVISGPSYGVYYTLATSQMQTMA
jgi:hypothetical protein